MLILIAIILICSAMSDFAAASDWEDSELAEEENSEEQSEELTVLIPVQDADKSKQAGDMQGAQDRENLQRLHADDS